MSQIEVIDQILRAKIVAIVRKESASVALSTAEAVINGGLSVLEISLNTPNAVDVIAELAGSKNLCVGAGTVMSEHQVDGVVAAGATFMVSPNTNERVIKYARSAGLVVGPGVFTASDCANALENGADFLKLEPFAQLLSWLGYQPKELLCVKALSCDRQQPLHAFALRNQRNWVFRSTQPRHALQHFVWLQASHQDHSPPSQAGWNELNSCDWLARVLDQSCPLGRTSLILFQGQFQACS